jgi:hypothetical protein
MNSHIKDLQNIVALATGRQFFSLNDENFYNKSSQKRLCFGTFQA